MSGESLNFQDFGPDIVGVTNAWNTALAVCQSEGVGTLYFPQRYDFESKPNPITFFLTLLGDGPERSALVRNYQPATPDEGFIVADNSYIRIQGLDIAAADGTTGGCGLQWILGERPGDYGNWSWFRDLRVTSDTARLGTGTWKYGIYLDGDKSSAAPQAPGLRDIAFDNCFVRVTCSAAQLYAKTPRHFKWDGYFDVDGTVVITGGDYRAENVQIINRAGGILFADQTDNLTAIGPWSWGWLKPSVNQGVILSPGTRPFINQSSSCSILLPRTGQGVAGAYEIVRNGSVVNRISWDGMTPFPLADGCYLRAV